MGKPTGFLEYNRKTSKAVSPAERISNFNEFHESLTKEEHQIQGARCMNCGVPFCQSGMMLGNMMTGCPLHNLIPEWNDEIYNDNWERALSRLTKTNNFPEFTGRVCPALCEAACTCNMQESPVSIKENELAIIEYGFENGLIKPNIPPLRTGKKIAVIGSGPSGLAAADRLNHRGHSVTVFEKDDRIGGLLMYGIPNMKLDKSIVERRVDLMIKEGVKFLTEVNVGKDISAEEILNDFDAVILCCGAGQPRELNVPGKDAKGVYFAVDFLKSTTKSLLNSNLSDGKYISAKNKNVVIVGGGDTGNDCVGTCIRHGAKSVTQLEMMPPLPEHRTEKNPWPEFPRVLKTDYGQEEAIAVFGHDPRIYQTTVKEIKTDSKGRINALTTVKVEFKDGICEIPGSEREIKADLLLIAAGFTGCQGYVPSAFGVKTGKRNTVETQNGSYATNVDKVFTAGDMHIGQSLVVRAIAEGRECAKEVDRFLMGYTNMI